jgi:hypothetical protein
MQEVVERFDATNPAITLPQQLLVAQERAASLGAELGAQTEREGLGGVVGPTCAAGKDGERIEVSEATRAVFDAERAFVVTVSEKIARLGVDTGRMVAARLQTFAAELGLSMSPVFAISARTAQVRARLRLPMSSSSESHAFREVDYTARCRAASETACPRSRRTAWASAARSRAGANPPQQILPSREALAEEGPSAVRPLHPRAR